jgi:NAD(P)-dependent dehydrogenase (short-subunit alcohol dehydrogenase family)
MSRDFARLDGAVALVSGAAGCLGIAMCEELSDAGAKVVATDLRHALEPAHINCSEKLELDVTEEDNWIDVIAQVEQRYGRLDILVNNAGIAPTTRLETLALEDWRKCQSINVDGCFLGMKSSAALMKKSGELREGGASVINVSSIAGFVGGPNAAAYCTSKGAVRLLTKATAIEFSALGYAIRVNSIHPGSLDTDMLTGITERVAAMSGQISPADVKARFVAAHPLGRLGRPDEIASGIRFLASPNASFIHGTELVIDGGLLAR